MAVRDADALPRHSELVDGVAVVKAAQVFPPSQEYPAGTISILASDVTMACLESPSKELWGGIRLTPLLRGGPTVNIAFDAKSAQDMMDLCGRLLADFASAKPPEKPRHLQVVKD